MRHRRMLAGMAAVAFAAAAGARRLAAFEIADRSMEPVLRPGDWVLGTRRPRQPRRGDVVVFEHPQRPGFHLVKRVAGIPGDEMGRAVLADGELWVLGDNPAAGSVDSGALGSVRTEWMRARLFLRYRPLPPARVR